MAEEVKEIRLKVGELTAREEAGRGIVRLESSAMSKIGVKPGDVIEIEGTKKTGAIALRSYPADVGLNIIRMDGITRRNAGSGVGEYVKVRKADVKEARSITLAPAQRGMMIQISPSIVKQNIYKRPVTKGDIIIPSPIVKRKGRGGSVFEEFFGIDFESDFDFFFTPMPAETKFVVVNTNPSGIVRVDEITEIEIMPELPESLKLEERAPVVTYEDVGGIKPIIEKVREIIELPLRHPELFERLGIEAPKGVLLYGPPGCVEGNTLIALEDGRILKISDIAKNLTPGIYLADLPIFPPASAKVLHIYDVPETVEIITETGKRLRVTLNHPLLTLDGWKEAEKLNVGEKIKVVNWIPSPTFRVKVNEKLKSVQLPEEWDEDLATIMGIFIAEGYVDCGRIAFTINKNEEEFKKIIIEKMKKCFGLENYRFTIPKVKNSIRIRFGNAELARWFSNYHKKEVPLEILLSPNDVVAAFLRGLFEGDGSAYFVTKKRIREYNTKDYKSLESHRTVSLKSSSRLLLEQVQVLLLRWNIVGRIYEYKSNRGGYPRVGYALLIRGKQNLESFKKHIGFLSAQKNAKLSSCVESYKRNLKTHLPKEFEKIKEIKRIKGWERVYDFEVPSTHSFFTNGILSHNTGKTLLAKAVANESGSYFISVSAPEVMSKWYGESEQNIKRIFEEAEKNAPAIIFIDEIDAIAPKREEVTGEVERRVVSTLLSQMDGLKSRGKVIVIAATNRPNSLDPALRRPGRFDREIEFPVPDRNGRLEILKIHTRNMPLAKDVNLEHLADITYGYVGADLAALCKEAAMAALRRVLPEIKWKEEKELPREVMEKLVVTKEDFENALKMVEPSAMREVLVEVPKVKWEDIGGLEDVKQQLREMIEWPLKNPEAFRRLGIEPPRGILLYGPPGCGKTLLAKAVANESGANFIAVKGPEVLTLWVGESERRIRELFRRARQVAPAIIFFDEIDALATRRGLYRGSAVTETVVSQLLTEMSGIEETKGVVVIAATNRPDMVDPALLRPGRIDRFVLIPPPDEKSRLAIFKVHTKNMPLAKDVDLRELAKKTEGYSGADIEAACREAAMNALRENPNAKEVKSKHFEEALKKVSPSISKDTMTYYQKFIERTRKPEKEKEVSPAYIG